MLGLLQGMSRIGNRGGEIINTQPIVWGYRRAIVGRWSGTGRGKTTGPWVQSALVPALLATFGQRVAVIGCTHVHIPQALSQRGNGPILLVHKGLAPGPVDRRGNKNSTDPSKAG